MLTSTHQLGKTRMTLNMDIVTFVKEIIDFSELSGQSQIINVMNLPRTHSLLFH